jgi:PQQ-dependent catabolism-associated CXXCW motif protein
MAHDVFVSYSSQDRTAANAVCAVLEQNGIRCWIAPRDIMPGERWGAAIVSAINRARAMVLVFSRHANESAQVEREVERVVNRGIPLIPVRIEDVVPSDALEFFISTPHWLDAFTPPLEQHLQYLTQVLRQVLARPVPDLPEARSPAAAEPLVSDALSPLRDTPPPPQTPADAAPLGPAAFVNQQKSSAPISAATVATATSGRTGSGRSTRTRVLIGATTLIAALLAVVAYVVVRNPDSRLDTASLEPTPATTHITPIYPAPTPNPAPEAATSQSAGTATATQGPPPTAFTPSPPKHITPIYPTPDASNPRSAEAAPAPKTERPNQSATNAQPGDPYEGMPQAFRDAMSAWQEKLNTLKSQIPSAPAEPDGTSSDQPQNFIVTQHGSPPSPPRSTSRPTIRDANYGDEKNNFNVSPQNILQTNVSEPTPTTIEGGRVLSTYELRAALQGNWDPILIDAWDDSNHQTLPDANRLPQAGSPGNFNDAVEAQLFVQLLQLSNNDFSRPLVFFCAGVRCWESYNAALRAINAGFHNVYWYRGGVFSWKAAGLPTTW